ncbi:MAG: hypothetical protein GC160_03205 [Acidobacteria bacterium]|nr:hypothetical protein [Acidobacteriota bacterium]
MNRSLFLVALLLSAGLSSLAQQAPAPPTRQEAERLIRETLDLMEAAAVVTPELSRAGAPLTENVRAASETLRSGAVREHVGVVYTLLTNARVYIQLVDALPKPADFSDDVRKQLEQLRVRVDKLDQYFRSLLEQRERQLRLPDRDNLTRYREANTLVDPPVAGENRVVFLGDSITDGWELNQYFPSERYINRGISGQITGQMLGRLQADVIALDPKAMVLLGGTNDLARGVDLEIIRNNITMIADLAEAHGVHPILASILPVSDYHQDQDPRFHRTTDRRPEDIRALNDWLRGFCHSRGYDYLDYFAATVDDKGYLKAELADDGLHPNTEGYKVMAPLAQQAIKETLRTAPQKRERKRFGVF